MTSDNSMSVLFVGGTGAISASCVAEAVSRGFAVSVLNRGSSSSVRPLPPGVEQIVADANDAAAVTAALRGRRFDAVVHFLLFQASQVAPAVEVFGPVTRHFVHISSVAAYQRPLPRVPLNESTALGNPRSGYSQGKAEVEEALMRAWRDTGFPVTIVRPAHTYDGAILPVPGGWAVADRLERGEPVVVHGDGTSLWSLTHAADLAVGLVGLLGRRTTHGEAYQIMSRDTYTWDQIYTIVADGLGVEPRLVHVPTEWIAAAEPGWFWSGLLDCDFAHSGVFDTSKIERAVPAFAPRRIFEQEVASILAFRRRHPEHAVAEPESVAAYERLATRCERAFRAFGD